MEAAIYSGLLLTLLSGASVRHEPTRSLISALCRPGEECMNLLQTQPATQQNKSESHGAHMQDKIEPLSCAQAALVIENNGGSRIDQLYFIPAFM